MSSQIGPCLFLGVQKRFTSRRHISFVSAQSNSIKLPIWILALRLRSTRQFRLAHITPNPYLRAAVPNLGSHHSGIERPWIGILWQAQWNRSLLRCYPASGSAKRQGNRAGNALERQSNSQPLSVWPGLQLLQIHARSNNIRFRCHLRRLHRRAEMQKETTVH